MFAMRTLALGICAFAMLSGSADARIVTITFTNTATPMVTNIFEVQPTEIMRGLSVGSFGNATSVYFVKDGVEFPFGKDTVVAGPATLKVVTVPYWNDIPQGVYATVEVGPESFPPDNTIIIPEGTGARVALECSTNLTHWAEIFSSTETNAPASKFFRIKAERIP